MAVTNDLSQGIILEDSVVSIRIGDRFVGAAPVFAGDGVNIIAKVKRIEYHETTDATNVAGASGRERHRFHNDKDMMTLEGVVDYSGSLFNALAGNARRRNIEVTYLPNSTLTNPWVKTGVITDFVHTGAQGEATTEKIEIDLNADYPPAS